MLDLQAFFRDFVKSVNFLFLRLVSAVKIYNHFIKILERRQHKTVWNACKSDHTNILYSIWKSRQDLNSYKMSANLGFTDISLSL